MRGAVIEPVLCSDREAEFDLLETLRLARCQMCSCFFETGKVAAATNLYSKLARENFKQAIDTEKGLMFWNREVAARKKRLGLRMSAEGSTFERRFICPDCVHSVFAEFALYRELE